MSQLSANRLREMLTYEPATGDFIWRNSGAPWMYAGNEAGWLRKDGYRFITVDRQTYGAHRLARLYMTGSFAPQEIDHKDGNPSNNKWDNLRAATRAQNNQNRRSLGISRANAKWRACIKTNGRQRHIGVFDTKEAAITAYQAARRELFGDFANV